MGRRPMPIGTLCGKCTTLVRGIWDSKAITVFTFIATLIRDLTLSTPDRGIPPSRILGRLCGLPWPLGGKLSVAKLFPQLLRATLQEEVPPQTLKVGHGANPQKTGRCTAKTLTGTA